MKDELAALLPRLEGVEVPVRVQLSRAKGWRMPPNTVKVDRSTRWGNHIVVGEERGIGYRPWTAEDAVEQYRIDIENEARADRADGTEPLDLSPLRGKNLACWCKIHVNGKPVPCHADVLLSLANDIPLDEVIRENLRRAKGEAAQ